MPAFTDHLSAALDQYPSEISLLRWRSSESKTAVDYLRGELGVIPRNEPVLAPKLMAVVSYLVKNTPAAPGQPGNLLRLRLKPAGRLHGLLTTAWDSHKRGLAVSAREDNKRLNYFDGTQKRLATDPGAQAIELGIRQKYDAVIAGWRSHNPNNTNTTWTKIITRERVSAIAINNRVQHLGLIDGIWAEFIDTFPATTAVSAMTDPAVGAYPSSRSNGGLAAFSTSGFCFRCDSRDPASVTTYGFKPLYAHNPPPEILETWPLREVQAGRAGMFKDNRDAVGEMVVCVSREMRGATKFPSPGYAGIAYVYALKLPTTDQGFDTEHWQTTLPTVSLWKPGEKAMREVKPAQVLGHVQVTKSPAAGGNEYFRVRFDANHWTFTPHASGADQIYLNAELAAIYNAGVVFAINIDEDFLLG